MPVDIRTYYKENTRHSMNITRVDDRTIICDGHVYRRPITVGGRYTKQMRREYMKQYRAKKKNTSTCRSFSCGQ